MAVWYIAYNLELTKKCYLLKNSEGIHDEGAMKSGTSGFDAIYLCVPRVQATANHLQVLLSMTNLTSQCPIQAPEFAE